MAQEHNLGSDLKKRISYIYWWVVSIICIPIVLDYIFLGSSVARYSRVLILLVITSQILINKELFLSGTFVGFNTTLLTFFLYLTGTVAGLSRGGVITPNIASLILLMSVVGLNFDLYQIALKAVSFSLKILITLSVIVILLKLNPREIYSSAEGYPVFFSFLGIPGRNYGIFPHPNSLGQAAALSILFTLESRTRLLFLALPVFCMLKCGSRTAIIAIIVGILIYGLSQLINSKEVAKRKRIETPVVIGTLLLGIFSASSLQFLSYIRYLSPESLTGRASIWQSSLEIFRGSSMFGLGWGWEQRAIDAQLLNAWAVSAHNAILEIIFSSGVVGIIIFIVILVKGIVYFPNLLTIEKMIFLSILASGVSESYIDLQYPTIQTIIFFLMILGSNIERSPLDE